MKALLALVEMVLKRFAEIISESRWRNQIAPLTPRLFPSDQQRTPGQSAANRAREPQWLKSRAGVLPASRLLAMAMTVMALAIVHSHAVETEWKAGLAEVKITPDKPVPMAGYAARTKPFEDVAQDIYA